MKSIGYLPTLSQIFNPHATNNGRRTRPYEKSRRRNARRRLFPAISPSEQRDDETTQTH
jgi:hypothetical protein